MTVKEASEQFGKSERQIRQAIKDGLLQARKEKRKYIIPNNTEIIILKSEIQAFLLEILKYKNNKNTPLNRSLCPTENQLKVLAKYLYYNGFVGECNVCNEAKSFFDKVQLTDRGLLYAIGKKNYDINITVSLSIQPGFNFALVKIF